MNEAEVRHMLSSDTDILYLQRDNELLIIENAKLQNRVRELEYNLAQLTRK